MNCKNECRCSGETIESLELVKSAMISEDEINEIARLLKIFSDPTRLKLLSALSHSELCVQHLTEVVEMKQSAVSHQLKTLKAERLVKSKRNGKMVYYSLNDDHIQKILDMALDHIRE